MCICHEYYKNSFSFSGVIFPTQVVDWSKISRVMLLCACNRSAYNGDWIHLVAFPTFCTRETTVFVCVEVLWPSQPSGVMSSLPNHTYTGQA